MNNELVKNLFMEDFKYKFAFFEKLSTKAEIHLILYLKNNIHTL